MYTSKRKTYFQRDKNVLPCNVFYTEKLAREAKGRDASSFSLCLLDEVRPMNFPQHRHLNGGSSPLTTRLKMKKVVKNQGSTVTSILGYSCTVPYPPQGYGRIPYRTVPQDTVLKPYSIRPYSIRPYTIRQDTVRQDTVRYKVTVSPQQHPCPGPSCRIVTGYGRSLSASLSLNEVKVGCAVEGEVLK